MLIGSWHFFVFVLTVIVLMQFLSSPRARSIVLFLFNIYFISFFITSWISFSLLIIFLLTVYLAARIFSIYKLHVHAPIVVGAFIIFFAFLCIVKEPGILPFFTQDSQAWVPLVGISYMVFRGLSYLIDAEISKDTGLLSFINYMIFFPSLLAGPIARHEEFTQSIRQPLDLNEAELLTTLHRILNGCLKKFIIADNLAIFTNINSLAEHSAPTLMLWFGALLVLFIVYMDFSGYTDIAVGIARLMRIQLPENFNKPFAARNIQEFWLRWHMSLTSFITDYIFMPLSKYAYKTLPSKAHFLSSTFIYAFCLILIALWHGITIGYFVFGLANAILLILLQCIRRYKNFLPGIVPIRIKTTTAYDWVCRASTYSFVSMVMAVSALPNKSFWSTIKCFFPV